LLFTQLSSACIRKALSEQPNKEEIQGHLVALAYDIAVCTGKSTLVEKDVWFQLAEKVARAKGIRIVREMKRRKDGILLWFCQNAPELTNYPVTALGELLYQPEGLAREPDRAQPAAAPPFVPVQTAAATPTIDEVQVVPTPPAVPLLPPVLFPGDLDPQPDFFGPMGYDTKGGHDPTWDYFWGPL
jgi:hypothetical protein